MLTLLSLLTTEAAGAPGVDLSGHAIQSVIIQIVDQTVIRVLCSNATQGLAQVLTMCLARYYMVFRTADSNAVRIDLFDVKPGGRPPPR